MSLCEHILFEFGYVVDACHSHYSEFAEMAVYYYRLSIGIRNYAYAAVARKFMQVPFKFCAEISVFDIVDRPGEYAVVYCGHACTFSAHVAVVIDSVKKIVHALLFGSDAKKTSHN